MLIQLANVASNSHISQHILQDSLCPEKQYSTLFQQAPNISYTPFSVHLVLAEEILNLLPLLLRLLMKPAPNLHQLLPMMPRLLRRQQPLRHNAILPHHLHNLSRQLAPRRLASSFF